MFKRVTGFFNRVTGLFNDLSIRGKLEAGFGVLLVLTLLVGVALFVMASIRNAALEGVLDAQRETAQVYSIETETLEARRHEKDFLLNYVAEGYEVAYENYVIPNQERTQDVLDLIATMRLAESIEEEEREEEESVSLDQIEQALLAYQAAFIEIATDDIPKRGDEDSGLVGDFVRVFAELDKATEAAGNFEIEAAAAEALVIGRDYIHDLDDEDIEGFHEQMTVLQAAVQHSDLTAAQKDNMNALADNALVVFDQLVEQDEELNREIASFHAAAESIGPLVAEFEEGEVEELNEALSSYRAADRLTWGASAILVVLVFITSVGLRLLISRPLTRQVDEIDKVFRAAAVGEFDARAEVFSKDELGRMAEGINAMLAQLTGLIALGGEQLQAILDNIPARIWVQDTEGTVTAVNRTFTGQLGITPEQVVGQSIYSLSIDEEQEKKSMAIDRQVLETGEAITTEEVYESQPGAGTQTFLLTRFPIRDAQGNVTLIGGTATDITERAELLAEMARLTAQLSTIVDHSASTIISTDPDGVVQFYNETAERMLGYAADELVGKESPAILHDFDEVVERARELSDELGELIEPGFEVFVAKVRRERVAVETNEWTYIAKNGNRIPIILSVTALRDDSGEITGFMGIGTDITERERAEEAVRQSEELLRSTVDATPDWIFVKDPDFRYLLANKSFAGAIGTTPEAMIGKDDLEVGFPEELVFGDPEKGISGFRTDDRAVVERGEMLHNPYDPATTADGELRIFDTYKMPLRDERGEVWGALGFARDVTERTQLVDQMARQTAVLENTTDFVGIADMEGRALYINPAGLEMTGYAGVDPTTLSIASLQPPDSSRIIVEEAIPTAMERGTWSGELEFMHADGTHIPVSQVVVVIRDQTGQPVANATIARDIRERKQVEADVTGLVGLLVGQSETSAQVVEKAATSALEGNQAVHETVAAMDSIRDNTQETARRIKRLGEASQEISEVVRLIEELADRTTVLALNASIQAAAAGEAGRGFAVVAEEVQRLAERATGETRRIEDLVKTIQAETNEAAVGIEEATREVVEGSQLAQQAGERMDELNRLVSDLASLVQHVAETTARQTTESLAILAGAKSAVQARSGGDGYASPDGDGAMAPSARAGDGAANT